MSQSGSRQGNQTSTSSSEIGSLVTRMAAWYTEISAIRSKITTCLGCRDTGMVRAKTTKGVSSIDCPVVSRSCKYGKKMLIYRKSIVDETLKSCGIPIACLETRYARTMPITCVIDWMRIHRSKRPIFLVLTGDTGTGKSMAASFACRCMANASMSFKKFIMKENIAEMTKSVSCNIRWYHAYEMKAKRDSLESDIERCKLLVIDDISAELVNSDSKSLFNYIVSKRYDNNLQTIITTNVSPEMIDEIYGRRVSERLLKKGVVEYFGESVRFKEV